MEGPLARDLQRDTGIAFSGEGKGSKALANLIQAHLRTPDVFISADTSLLEAMRRGPQPLISSYTVFGSARMLIACGKTSHLCDRLDAARTKNQPLLPILARARLGRTDPQLDPKGLRTVKTVDMLGKIAHNAADAQTVLRNSAVFPEEDLAVRVESGELDGGFFYSTETPGRELRPVELPESANLSGEITYGLAILNAAPHTRQALSFADYVLHGNGRKILEAAGLRYFSRPVVAGTR